MPRTHNLKIHSQYYKPIEEGVKTFEIRNNDREYEVDDYLILEEFTNYEYTGKAIKVKVTYITDYAQIENHVVMSIVKA